MKLLAFLIVGGAVLLCGLFAISGELSKFDTKEVIMLIFLGSFGGAGIWIQAFGFVDRDDSET
jgi:hypothetical protein